MKKVLSLTLVLLMIASTLALTSCDQIASMIPDEVKSFIPDAVYDIFPDLARTTITEEELAKIYEENNFTAKVSMTMGEETMEVEMLQSNKGTKQTQTYAGESETRWLIVESDGVYELIEEDGKYYGEKVDDEYNYTTLSEILPELSLSDLKYDEENHCYRYAISEDGSEGHIVLRFRNGKLYTITMSASAEGISIEYLFTNIGKTEIDVPAYTKR